MNANQVDTQTQIAIKLDKIDSVLALLFESLQPESSLDSIPKRHLESLVHSGIEDVADIRAILDAGRIISTLQEAAM